MYVATAIGAFAARNAYWTVFSVLLLHNRIPTVGACTAGFRS